MEKRGFEQRGELKYFISSPLLGGIKKNMKFHPLLLESQVTQKKVSGETCWKKSCCTCLAENIAPFICLKFGTDVYVGLRARKPVLRWVCQFSFFLRKEQAKPSFKIGCCDSEMLFQPYNITCEMGESGSFFNCWVYCAPSMSLGISLFLIHRAMFMCSA